MKKSSGQSTAAVVRTLVTTKPGHDLIEVSRFPRFPVYGYGEGVWMSEYSKGPVVPTWYLAYEIQWLDTPATVESDKRTVWENVLLVEASDLEDAYAQAVDLGAQRQGGLLNEMRGFVQLTPEEDRKLDSIVRFVGLSKLVPLPSQPCDCLVFEWRARSGPQI